MKRTATTLALLAGLGGSGCVSSDSQHGQPTQRAGGYGTVTRGKEIGSVQGPMGEPVMAVRGAAPSGVQQAGGATLFGDMNIRPAGAVSPYRVTAADGSTTAFVPGMGGVVMRDPNIRLANGGYGPPDGQGYGVSVPYGPRMPNMPQYGIQPVPSMGPPGVVAAGPGAMMPGMGGMGMGRPAMANGRSSINFTGPAGMKVTWQLPDGSFNDEKDALTAPKEYNFLQGQVYRLRLTSILPDHPGKSFYPTLEVAPANAKTLTFLSHSSVPLTFAPDDFAQAKAGNLVVKVVYLPDPINQDFSTIIGAEEVVSTRLEPGADPVAEAQRRGTILAVIRMGNIDLENRVSPAMTAPPPGMLMPGPRPVPGLPNPKPFPELPKGGAPDSLPPIGAGPLAPVNPPGTATVKPPASLPELPPISPVAPMSPVAPDPKPAK
jgi:hypothetical protein